MSSGADDVALTVTPAPAAAATPLEQRMKAQQEANMDRNAPPAADSKKTGRKKRDGRNAQPPGGPQPHYDEIAYAWAHRSEMDAAPLADGKFSSSSADLKIDVTEATPKQAASAGGDADNKPPPLNRPKSTMPPSFQRAVSLMKPGFDADAMERLRVQVARFSAFCLFVNAMVVILGFAVANREVGPFAVSNFFTLAAFLIGTVIFYQTEKQTRMLWAQIYFVFLYLLMAIGFPLALYYAGTVPRRVDEFCAREDQRDDPCTAGRREELKGWGFGLGFTGAFIWYMVFSFFARHVFVLCARSNARIRPVPPKSNRK